jgi:hypothetical protein
MADDVLGLPTKKWKKRFSAASASTGIALLILVGGNSGSAEH